MTIACVGNLGCERAWAGLGPLPAPVRRRAAALATLMRALVDAPACAVFTDAAVEPARTPPVPGLPALTIEPSSAPTGRPALVWGALDDRAVTAGVPCLLGPAYALAPARARARQLGDRRWAAALAERLGVALPGRDVVTDLAGLRAHLARPGALGPGGRWVGKAPWTAAGRDRVHGTGPVVDGELAARVTRLLAGQRALVVEPWLDRVGDAGIVGAIAADGRVELMPPHRLWCDERGGFRGVDTDDDGLPTAARAALVAVAAEVGAALAADGHLGPFGLDALLHRDPTGAVVMLPLVEINPRLTFGTVAWALARRLGRAHLRVGPAAPDGALVLVAPGTDEPVAAWLED